MLSDWIDYIYESSHRHYLMTEEIHVGRKSLPDEGGSLDGEGDASEHAAQAVANARCFLRCDWELQRRLRLKEGETVERERECRVSP